MRSVDAGNCASLAGGRIGRRTSSPLQFGQRPPSRVLAQRSQKVHSNEQMRASADAGGKSASQHSQDGRSWSISASDGNRGAPVQGRRSSRLQNGQAP
jgi:hypothetical protein